MILELSIENYILIEKQHIHFHKGLNMITGETGAGKSIVLGALEAIFGGRVDKAVIRRGKASAVLQATLDVGDLATLEPYLSDMGLVPEDGLMTVSREIRTEGKHISRINGKIVTQSVIRELAALYLEITGQHDQQDLLETRHQLLLLDDFIGDEAEAVRQQLAEDCQAIQQLKSQLQLLDLSDEEAARRLDLLDYQIEEIHEARFMQGEDDELEERFRLLRHAEKLRGSLQSSIDKLGGDRGASALLSSATRELSSVSGYAEDLEALRREIEELYYDLEAKTEGLKTLLNRYTFSMQEIEETETRLNLINHLKRKYGKSFEDIQSYREKMEAERSALLSLASEKEKLEKTLLRQNAAYWEKAEKLESLRTHHGKLFAQTVEAVMQELNFKNARFSVEISRVESLSPLGSNKVIFMIATNLGESLQPLSKVASGGELSRIMLAIKTVIGEKDAVPVVIFDEIDTGISGITATTVGQKIKSIASYSQTLCVTHLPQIAVFADQHIVVEKADDQEHGTTYATLRALDQKERVLEISRMAGGASISEAALENAREMLEKAASTQKTN